LAVCIHDSSVYVLCVCSYPTAWSKDIIDVASHTQLSSLCCLPSLPASLRYHFVVARDLQHATCNVTGRIKLYMSAACHSCSLCSR
jgi:hypothetical protein